MCKRIDLYLVENGYAQSRERAKLMIKNNGVLINGKNISKPSATVAKDDCVEVVVKDLNYVGRGALKLEQAFTSFDFDINSKVCADIGASTGGFTEVMLDNDAKKVYAIDVGHDQLADKLINDNRVINCEGTNVKNLTREFFNEDVSFMSVDLSFISLKLVLKILYDCLCDNGEIIILIKPQFEAGKKALNKKGIVKDRKTHVVVLSDVLNFARMCGFNLLGLTFSSIRGGDGNIEYLAFLGKSNTQENDFIYDFKLLVDEAFTSFEN